MLHLDQKAAKCTTPTCKPFCGKFSLFIATKSFKTRFWAKFPVAKGLINVVSAVIFSGKEKKKKKRKSFYSKGWRSHGESARLPLMWPGFKSRRRRQGSLPCSFLRVLRFSPLLKNQHFQIPIRPGIRRTKDDFLDALPPNYYYYYYY